MDPNILGEPDRIPWRMHGCFPNPPYIHVETMDNLLHKHACINVPSLPCMAVCFIPTPTSYVPVICVLVGQETISLACVEEYMKMYLLYHQAGI